MWAVAPYKIDGRIQETFRRHKINYGTSQPQYNQANGNIIVIHYTNVLERNHDKQNNQWHDRWFHTVSKMTQPMYQSLLGGEQLACDHPTDQHLQVRCPQAHDCRIPRCGVQRNCVVSMWMVNGPVTTHGFQTRDQYRGHRGSFVAR